MKREAILKSRNKLAEKFPDPTEILRGSLLQRTIRHRQGCQVCARGEGHRVWVLTVSYKGGKTRQLSIRPEQKALVEKWIRNYQQLRAKLEAICEINQELLRAEP